MEQGTAARRSGKKKNDTQNMAAADEWEVISFLPPHFGW
jgi:hypothetical protein